MRSVFDLYKIVSRLGKGGKGERMRIDIAICIGATTITLIIYWLADTIVIWFYPWIY